LPIVRERGTLFATASLALTALLTILCVGSAEAQLGEPRFQLLPAVGVELASNLGHPALLLDRINRDIFLDLVVVSDEGLIVFLGAGNGTFNRMGTFSTGDSPNAVGAGDFDNDGDLDLVATTFADNVAILLGDGQGSFDEPTFASLGDGSGPTALLVTRIDGDAALDLAVVNLGDDSLTVLRGRGDGTFDFFDAAATAVPTTGIASTAIVGDDFNNDGFTDLAIVNEISEDVSVFLGNGNGTFRNPRRHGTGMGPTALAVGRINGDAFSDLAVANTANDVQNGISILLGQSTGVFQSQRFVDPTSTDPNDIRLADIDGDGVLDTIVTSTIDSTLGINLGFGDGEFGALLSAANVPGLVVGDQQVQLAVGDLDNSALPDIVVLRGPPRRSTAAT
jgi:hypothetical protein